MIKLRILSYEGEPRLSRWGKCSYKGFYKRETGVSEMCEEGADITKEDAAPLALQRKGPQVTVCKQHLKTGRGKKTDSPLTPPEVMPRCEPILTPDLQSCRIINFCSDNT